MTDVCEPYGIPVYREDATQVGEGNGLTGKRGNMGTSCVCASGFVGHRRAPPRLQLLHGRREVV